MTRGTEDAFDALHALTVRTLEEQIQAYRIQSLPVPPQLLAQAIKLLKDNGVDAPSRARNLRDTLAEVLPDFALDEDEGAPH